jgi:3-dehydroquinate synthetase
MRVRARAPGGTVPSLHKIVKLGLEEVVREGLVDGRSQPEILEELNTELVVRHDRKKGDPPRVSKAALERYLASLPEDTAAVVHRQEVAESNARMALDFGKRFRERMGTLDKWVEEVDGAHQYMTVDGKKVDLGPDWSARKSMMSEERRWMQLYADLMERIYNAAQVQEFQETVMEAIRDVEPEVAAKIAERLQERTANRAQAILGSLAA